MSQTNPVTPPGRVAFPSVFKPRENTLDPGKDPKYEITLLFPKDLELAAIKGAIAAAIKKEYTDTGKKIPPGFKKDIFKDGDSEQNCEKQGYPGHWAVTFRSKYPPGVVSNEKLPNGAFRTLDEKSREMYGGCWARVAFRAYCYDAKVNKGVSLELLNVQKVRDDEPFGRGPSDPNDDFSDGYDAVTAGMSDEDFLG